MNKNLFTLIEIALIAGLIAGVMYFGGLFKTDPAPTPTPTRSLNPTQPPRLTPTALQSVTATSPANVTRTPTFADTPRPLTQPSGLIAFTSNRDGNAEVYVTDTAGLNPRNLTNNLAEDYLIGWSPNGQTIAFYSTRSQGWLEIFLMAADGSNPVQLTHTFGTNTVYIEPISWMPDGQTLLAMRTNSWYQYPRSVSLELLPLTGSSRVLMVSNDNIFFQPHISADGQYLAVFMNGSSLKLSPLDKLDTFELVIESCTFLYTWRPSGHTLDCTDGGHRFSTINPDKSDKKSWDLNMAGSDGSPIALAWSPDGSVLLVVSTNWGAQRSDRTFSLFSPNQATNHIFYKDKAQSNSLNTFQSRIISWAPDSQWITFHSTEDGQADIYMLNVYSGTDPVRLTQNSGDNYSPQWQPSPNRP